jgi:hypothetical protein
MGLPSCRPCAIVLAVIDRPVQARRSRRASQADPLGPRGLRVCGAGVPGGEERAGLNVAAGRGQPPVSWRPRRLVPWAVVVHRVILLGGARRDHGMIMRSQPTAPNQGDAWCFAEFPRMNP